MRMRVDYERRVISIDSEEQILKMLRVFDMEDSPVASSPCPTGHLPTEADIPEDEAAQAAIREEFDMYCAVGHLNFIQQCTHPEISVPLKRASGFCKAYGSKHVGLIKHMMRWLKGAAHNKYLS